MTVSLCWYGNNAALDAAGLHAGASVFHRVGYDDVGELECSPREVGVVWGKRAVDLTWFTARGAFAMLG